MLVNRHYTRLQHFGRWTLSIPRLRSLSARQTRGSPDATSYNSPVPPATAVLYLPSTAAPAGDGAKEQEMYTHPTAQSETIKRPCMSVSVSESLDSALDSADAVYSVPLHQRKQRWKKRRQQLIHSSSVHHVRLPDSELVAKYCPLLAAAILLPAVLLLVAPQQMLQLAAVTSSVGSGAPTAAAEAVSSCFVQLVGLTWAFNAMLSLVVQGCVVRGQLGSTTCHRMLMATLLPLPASLLAVAKVAGSSCSIAGAAVVAALQLASFTVHVLLHLAHHPWFFVKVFWPIAVTILITEVVPTDWTFADGSGAAPFQAVIAAVFSVKVISRVPRLAAKFAPKLGKRWLLLIVNWLARRVLPRITAALAKIVPRLARHVGKLIPKLTRFGTRLAGRMAPRYAHDQLAGTTQKMAFPSADGLLTDTVARCIDLLPPRNIAAWCYMGLMAVQLLMVVNAYSPDMLFNTAALATAAVGSATAGVLLPAAAVAAGPAVAMAAAPAVLAAAAGDAWMGLLRYVKYSWGAGFFVAAFACNCLKTAADRDHLWRPANRQLNLAVGFLQAGMAVLLLLAMEAGAVLPSMYAWAHVAAGLAGTAFCCMQAAAPGLSQQQLLQIAAINAAATPAGSAMGSMHLARQQEVLQQEKQQSKQQHNLVLQLHNEGGACMSATNSSPDTSRDAAYTNTGGSTTDNELPLPPSSMQWESVELSDSRYGQVMQATVLLLTLLQLAL